MPVGVRGSGGAATVPEVSSRATSRFSREMPFGVVSERSERNPY
jgi:hypothetical protein